MTGMQSRQTPDLGSTVGGTPPRGTRILAHPRGVTHVTHRLSKFCSKEGFLPPAAQVFEMPPWGNKLFLHLYMVGAGVMLRKVIPQVDV